MIVTVQLPLVGVVSRLVHVNPTPKLIGGCWLTLGGWFLSGFLSVSGFEGGIHNTISGGWRVSPSLFLMFPLLFIRCRVRIGVARTSVSRGDYLIIVAWAGPR